MFFFAGLIGCSSKEEIGCFVFMGISSNDGGGYTVLEGGTSVLVSATLFAGRIGYSSYGLEG